VRGVVILVAVIGIVTLLAGVVINAAIGNSAGPSATPTTASVVMPIATATPAGDVRSTPWAATATPGGIVVPRPTAAPGAPQTPIETPSSLPPLPDVAQPELVSLTVGLARVRDFYSEAHAHGSFTVRWRPGAFPPERAAMIAEIAAESLDEVNRLLGTNDYEPMEIFLADQLFAEECWGCQGFAASDLRQVFILQDGSVADDELPVLLVHEIGHVIAGLHVALPHSLFFAEGLAVWISDADMTAAGYVSALQTAAWAHRAGILPGLEALRQAGYEGRVRARVEYDGAASFTFFFIESYGMDAYKEIYALTPPEYVIGKDWDELEREWRAYLESWADVQINGIGANEWWYVAQAVAAGYTRLYNDPGSVSVEQYAALVQARLELNRGNVPAAIALVNLSGLAPGLAN
jgi:hypothetical protein